MLLGNSFGKENIYEIILVLIGTMSQYEGVPYQFNLNMNLKSLLRIFTHFHSFTSFFKTYFEISGNVKNWKWKIYSDYHNQS